MIEYHTAVRGAFFDIARIADSADDIARHARYLDDGCLSSREKFRRCCRGRRANGTCIRKQAISICAGSCYSPVLSMRTCIIRKLR